MVKFLEVQFHFNIMKTLNVYKTYKLNIGDIILGEQEFNLGRTSGDIIEVGFTDKNQCIIEEDKVEYFFSKEKIFENKRKVKVDKTSYDENREKSAWLVESLTIFETFRGIYGTYPEHCKIVCSKVSDTDNEKISFYIYGKFDNVISKKFEVIGKKE